MIRRKPQQVSTPGLEAGRFRPDVIVEFLFDEGMFFVSVNNIGNRPAIGVCVRFSKRIIGPDGKKDISALPLFNNIAFLGPGREIVAFIDASNSYFKRKQPTQISARVSYCDSEKQKYEVTIKHNLEIYRELPYLAPRPADPDCAR